MFFDSEMKSFIFWTKPSNKRAKCRFCL